MKTRYFIFISYKGTSYHGWQVQPNSVTIQQILDKTLSTILNEKISTTGAGRTDTGVHALVFCAHFDSMSPDLTEKKTLLFRLNRFLPKDISVSGISRVLPDAHARFSAVSRTYRYNISTIKDPFMNDSSWFVHGKIDTNILFEGNMVPMMDREGRRLNGVVKEISADNVKMDFNHPLAGTDLFFKGEITEIRDATEEELSHGHIHSLNSCDSCHDETCSSKDSSHGGCECS